MSPFAASSFRFSPMNSSLSAPFRRSIASGAASTTRMSPGRMMLVRARPGSADQVMGDVLCLSPPLSTPAETLDKIPQILREALLAATR